MFNLKIKYKTCTVPFRDKVGSTDNNIVTCLDHDRNFATARRLEYPDQQSQSVLQHIGWTHVYLCDDHEHWDWQRQSQAQMLLGHSHNSSIGPNLKGLGLDSKSFQNIADLSEFHLQSRLLSTYLIEFSLYTIKFSLLLEIVDLSNICNGFIFGYYNVYEINFGLYKTTYSTK